MTSRGLRSALAGACALVVAHVDALGAQAISVGPAGPPRPIAIARTPQPPPASAPARRPSSVADRIIVVVDRAPAYYYYGYGAAQPQTGGYVQEPMPPSPPEVSGPPPGPAMAWVPGYYQWNGSYQWVDGRWVPIPGGYTAWVPGRWAQNQLGAYWIPGYWR